MSRINYADQAQSRSIGIKPSKIVPVFETMMDDILKLNLSRAVSTLVVYFVRNKNNKKFILDLQKISQDIEDDKVDVNPSF